ncbi:unnamed protein product [Ambrosiozyma monospora]|uniref:Unnamed protein product n=1 Tax=Ambrosiozyma monospora TaxID=43982 RepID=A0ACB5T4B7_AMBMO|nr:unnamed protein product [Ambrosiozyma monospora]
MKFSTLALISTTAFAVSVTETDTEVATDIVTITSCNSDVKSCKYRSASTLYSSYYNNRTHSTVSSVSASSDAAPGSVYAAVGAVAAGVAAMLL